MTATISARPNKGSLPRGVVQASFLVGLATLGLSACGGSGGGAPDLSRSTSNSGTGYVAGVYMPSAQFKGQCAAPRPGNVNDHPGTTLTENLFLRSYSNETYLWYREVPDVNPSGYTTANYFDVLKTTATTPSGRAKDRFHFTYDTAVWESLSQSGVEYGYGAEWMVLAGAPPRRVVVGFTYPNEPASRLASPVQRGEEVRFVDGVDIDVASAAQLNDAFWPSAGNQTHSFTLRSTTGATRVVTLTSEAVTLASVQNVGTIATTSGPVGYIQFNDHLAQSEAALVTAINTLKTANVRDLIIDMRYNGGGYLAIASELGYMIAGPTNISGQRFELVQFNDKNPNTNPVTGETLAATPFYSTAQNFSVAGGTPLPTLGFTQVYMLTGAGTCSASEAVINGLRGIGVDVIQIGSTTCGKPYGFYGTDNCGTTYFTIQLQSVNAAGFGSYADGFIPQNGTIPSGTPAGAVLRGCSVADDFTHALGDPLEARLAAALNFRATGACPAPTGLAPPSAFKSLTSELDDPKELRGKSLLRENRWD